MDNGKQNLDETLDTRQLADADEVISSAGLERGEADGRPYGIIGNATSIVLQPGDDLRPFDQFNVWVYAAEGASGNLSVNVALKTTTEGLSARDNFSSGVATRIDWVGWQKCVFPYENFLIVGCPEGWVGVDRVRIRISSGASAGLTSQTADAGGVVGVGTIELEQRRRVSGPRLTDQGLFQELDLERPGLEDVSAAVAEGNLDRARARLLDYFSHREEPWHPFDPEIVLDSSHDTSAADRVCDHYVLNQQLPKQFDWRINPIGYLEWMHALNRHSFLLTLNAAYTRTGNEKYAEKLNYLLDTWMAQNPEPVGHNGGGDPAWETLSTSARPRRSWLDIWYGLRRSPSLRPGTRINMLKSFWAHAEHLTRYEGYRNNWFIVESETIAMLGVIFPEFKRAETWKTRGYERLSEAIAEQVWPDGAQYEISAGYHSMSGRGFELPYELALHNGIRIDALLAERLERMYEYTAFTARPDFSHPSINDSGGVSGGSADWAAKGGELFDRDDLRWVGTQGKLGSPPAEASHTFDDAGIYVMRSGWDPDAKYLILDAGAYSAAHQHEDKLSFELCFGSDKLIVDPGIASYMADPWTAYYKHTRSHNTVLVDGGGQTRRDNQTWQQWVRSVRGENLVEFGRGLDVVVSQYDAGYQGVTDPVTHQRAMVFLRDDCFLMLDRVSGEGEHDLEALFHFMPARVQVDGQRVRTDREGLKNVELAPLNLGTRLKPVLITGQSDPVQGWVANRENMPAPCASYRKRKVTLPASFGWVMVPYGSGRSAGLVIRKVRTTEGDAFNLQWADGRSDLVFWRWNSGPEARFGTHQTDCRFAVVRRSGSGAVTYAAGVDGTSLRGKGVDLSGEGLIESEPGGINDWSGGNPAGFPARHTNTD